MLSRIEVIWFFVAFLKNQQVLIQSLNRCLLLASRNSCQSSSCTRALSLSIKQNSSRTCLVGGVSSLSQFGGGTENLIFCVTEGEFIKLIKFFLRSVLHASLLLKPRVKRLQRRFTTKTNETPYQSKASLMATFQLLVQLSNRRDFHKHWDIPFQALIACRGFYQIILGTSTGSLGGQRLRLWG